MTKDSGFESGGFSARKDKTVNSGTEEANQQKRFKPSDNLLEHDHNIRLTYPIYTDGNKFKRKLSKAKP